MITLISITTIISGVVYLSSGFSVFLSWKKNKEDFLLKTFTTFLLSIGFQMFFLTLGLAVFFNNPLMSNISWWIAHIFMLVGTASLLLLPIRIRLATKEKLVRKIIISYIIIGGLILLLNLPKVELFTVDNVINWRVPGLNVAVIVLFASLASIFSVYVFISESFRIKRKAMKFRSIFLGLGILTFFIGGPMHNFVTNLQIAVVAALLSVLGGFFIITGVYLPQIYKQPDDI